MYNNNVDIDSQIGSPDSTWKTDLITPTYTVLIYFLNGGPSLCITLPSMTILDLW